MEKYEVFELFFSNFGEKTNKRLSVTHARRARISGESANPIHEARYGKNVNSKAVFVRALPYVFRSNLLALVFRK